MYAKLYIVNGLVLYMIESDIATPPASNLTTW